MPSLRSHRDLPLLFVLILAILQVASTLAHPHPDHPRDPRKIVALQALDAPDPLSPPAVSTMTLRTAVRRVNGLQAEDRADRDEDEGNRRNSTTFLVRAYWVLSQNGAFVRQLTGEVEVKPPFSVISLPAKSGRGSKTFARVDVSTTFDGRSGSGAMPSGLVSYQVFAEFVRIKIKKDKTKELVIDDSEVLKGTVTIQQGTPPLVLTVTSPQDGSLTREASTTVTGTVSGDPPFSVTIQGQAVSLAPDGSFSHVVPLAQEGANTITVVASGGGQTTEKTLTVIRDSVSPVLSIAEPAHGSASSDSTPLFRLAYSDASPSSSLDLTSLDLTTLKVMLNGSDISASFAKGSTEATFTPSAALSDGDYLVTALIKDRAGNPSALATSSFTIDTIQPTLSLSPESGAFVASSTPELFATYTDANLTTSSFSATLDGQTVAFTVGATRATFTPASPLSSASSHTLVVHIADAAGNTTERTSTFRIDDADPVVTLAPSSGSILASGATTIAVSFSDVGSGVDPGSVSLVLDGVNRSGDLIVGASEATLVVQLADGSHTAQASARDHVGREGSTSSTFRVDTQPPELTIVQPAQGETLTTTTPRFEVAFADPGGSGVVTSTFKAAITGVDRTVAFTITQTGATLDLAGSQGLAAGSHTFAVEIADAAGHRTTKQVSFTITQPVVGPQGVLVGQILSGDVCNNQPIAGATVKLLHQGAVATTDAIGRFRLSAPVGTAWVEVDKAGFLSVQRSGQVVEGQESTLATIFLAAEDSKVTHVVASEGGTVTDSTGNATLIIPPGALPQDADIRMTLITDARASKGPPLKNFIPGTAVRITPDRVVLNQYATVRVKNFMHMPVHPIFSFDWNPDTQAWERTVGAVITADGQFFESTINHFSGAAPGCGPLGPPGGGRGNGPGGCRCCGSGPAPSPFGGT